MHRFDDYQEFTETTDITAPAVRGFYYALGLAGESGEVADKIKKIYRDNNGEMDSFDKEDIVKELGDILWYIARLADQLGYKLSDLANMNVIKLVGRKNRDMLHGSGDNR